MTGRDYRDYLADMVEYGEAAVDFATGITLAGLETDVRTRFAIERALEVLGEAAGKVPIEVRVRYSDLPWAQMTGLRNRLAHGYFVIDPAVLCTIAVEVLPEILPRLREVALIEQANRSSLA